MGRAHHILCTLRYWHDFPRAFADNEHRCRSGFRLVGIAARGCRRHGGGDGFVLFEQILLRRYARRLADGTPDMGVLSLSHGENRGSSPLGSTHCVPSTFSSSTLICSIEPRTVTRSKHLRAHAANEV